MPTPRQFGRELDQNVRRGPNINATVREQIIAKRECGYTIKELVEEFGRSRSAIKYTIRTYSTLATKEDKPRSGRPPALSHHKKKIIYRKARAAPKIKYSQLQKEATFVSAEGTPSKPSSCST